MPQSWQKSIYFRFSSATFTMPWCWKKKLFPQLLIATTSTTLGLCQKKRIPMGYYVHYDHDKNISFYFSTTCTTPWPWQQIYFFSIIISISVLHSLGSNNEKKFPHCYYVHYMAIFFFFDAATFTTLWLALHPLCPG